MTSSPPPPPAPFPASPPQDATPPPPAFSPSPSIPPQPPVNNPPPVFSPPATPPSELPLPPSPPVGVTPPPIPEAVVPVQSPPSPSIPIVAAPISPNDPPHWSPQPSFPSLPPPPPPSEPPNPLSRVPPSTTLPSSHPSSTHPSYIGLIIGTTIGGVAAFILLIVLIILLICLKKKKINNECPPPKDKPNGVLPLQWKQRFPPQGSNVVPFHWNPFPLPPPLPPQLSSSTEDASDNNFTLRSQSSLTGGNFTYDELALATGNFSNDNLLGEGGFGYVHKGILPTGRQIAVKQLKTGSRQGEREFQAEVETISRVHHRHLVSLVGYCMTGAERLLVYEFVPNKTLYIHLHGIGQPVMEWATRMKIAIGSAKGLAYLHEDCNPTIIHRDIKASNILLDNKFEAKVSDFGLAKFFSDTNHDVTHVYTRVVGTFGYLAPEYAASGKASDRSDTFSFGVVLLELITGRPPINRTDSLANDSLVTWARPLLSQAMENGKFDLLVDPKLQGNYNDKEMKTMVACAAACVRHSAWRRPHMSQVVRALEGDVSLSDLDEGVRPGQSTLCSPINIPYYNMDELRLMTDFYTQENDTNSNRNYGSDGTAQIQLDSERCKRAESK